MTKKEIMQAFAGFSDNYCITTIERGKLYRVNYYKGFHRSNILHSLIRRNIFNWEPLKQVFFVRSQSHV